MKQVTPKMGITGIKNIYEDAAMVDEFRNLIDYKETYSLLQKHGEHLNISFNF